MAPETTMADAKTEAEDLMNAALPFATQTLTKHGEFFPFAYTLGNDGAIAMVAGYDGREHPPSQDIIDLLKDGLRADAAAHRIRATAIVYDVRVTEPKSGSKSDAIAVALDHKDRYSVVVFFPYTLSGSSLEVQEPFAEKGTSDVFSR